MSRNSASMFAALIAIYAMSLIAQAQTLPSAGPIWMKSSLIAKGDGKNGFVDCFTSAQDPVSGNKSNFRNTFGGYFGLSTVCNVYPVGHPESPVWSSSNNSTYYNTEGDPVQVTAACAGDGTGYQALGAGDLANFTFGALKSDCNGTFPITPGSTYQLTSQHYLWLVSPPNDDYCTGPFWDPYAYFDFVIDDTPWSNTLQGYDWWSVNALGTVATNTTSGDWATQGLQQTQQVINLYGGNGHDGDAGCTKPGDTIPQSGVEDSGIWELATTNATFTAIEIKTPELAFYQNQSYQLGSNLAQLLEIPGESNDNLNWCIVNSPTACNPATLTAYQGGAQGSFDGAQLLDIQGPNPTFFAPPNITNSRYEVGDQTVEFPTTEYVCGTETGDLANYGCATVTLTELFIDTSEQASVTLHPYDTDDFVAWVRFPEPDANSPPPANQVHLSSFSWDAWTLSPPSFWGGLNEPTTVSNTSVNPVESVYSYQAPSSPGTATLDANAYVQGVGPLKASTAILVTSNSASQTVNFGTIPAQVVGATYTLSATASSGLPVTYYSTTPATAVVNGNVASILAAGTATITAHQSGNSAYAAASASQSFTVNLAPQTITFPTIPAQVGVTSLALTAAASSGLPISFVSNTASVCTVSTATATFIAPGSCSLSAVQAGNAVYAPAIATQSFSVTPLAATPTFSPGAGVYNSIPTITLTDATPGSTIYYTYNGTTPTTSSTQYSAPIPIRNSFNVQAFAGAPGYAASPIVSAQYTLVALPPVVSPPAGTYPGPLTVTISNPPTGVKIFYTTNSSAAGTSSPTYTGPITVSSSELVRAISAGTGWTSSSEVSQAYTIEPYAATPTFSPAPGTYTGAQTITISDTTAGATIHYTTDGTAPTTSSSTYSGPIMVSASSTLNAIAVATGYSNSSTGTASYAIH